VIVEEATHPNTPADPGLSPHRQKTDNWRASDVFERFGLAALFAVVIVVFSVLRPHTFATAANWRSIATTQSVLAVLAMAMLPPLVCGRFDVSVGANMTLCAIGAAALMSFHGVSIVPAIVFAVALGTFVGFLNGVVVAYLGVNSIIATLGAATIMGGLVTAYTHGIPISANLPAGLTNLSIHNVAGVPVLFLLMAAIGVGAWFILTQTPFGRRLQAVGTNLSAARLTGLSVNRLVLLSFMLAGALSGIAGVLLIATRGSAGPDTADLGTILPSLAAAFLGATTWQPGRYNVPGTVLALFFLGAVTSGLALIGTQPWVTDVFNGTVVIVAVALGVQIKRQRVGSLEVGG
jgi:ribose transport system permease protein